MYVFKNTPYGKLNAIKQLSAVNLVPRIAMVIDFLLGPVVLYVVIRALLQV